MPNYSHMLPHETELMKRLHHVANTFGRLFDFRSQSYAGHCGVLHRIADERFGVVETMKEHLCGGHRGLRQVEQEAGALYQFAAEHTNVILVLRRQFVLGGRRFG